MLTAVPKLGFQKHEQCTSNILQSKEKWNRTCDNVIIVMFSCFDELQFSGFKSDMQEKIAFAYMVVPVAAAHLMVLASECNQFHSIR
jgi:hypothetical protein